MNNMMQTLKNISILAAALLIMVIGWIGAEVVKSSQLIDLARDPQASIQRGIDDAQESFRDDHAHFKSISIDGSYSKYPGVLKDEIEGKFKDFVFNSGGWCGTSFHLESIALKLEQYQHNEYYVLAYNLELVKLLSSKDI